MLNVSKQRVEEAQESCCNNEWLNGGAVRMLVEQVIVACSEAADVIVPGSSTPFISSNSAIWKGCSSSGDTLAHIESRVSEEVAMLVLPECYLDCVKPALHACLACPESCWP